MSVAQRTDRAARLAELLTAADIELMLVTDLVNVRYLTGYSGSNGFALVGPQRRTFVTDFRYVEQAAEEVDPSFDRVTSQQELIESLADFLPAVPVRLGFEARNISVQVHARISELVGDQVELVALDRTVEQLRAVKDAEELSRIQAATRLADTAFEELIAAGLAGRTEREAALALEVAMRRAGASGPSFAPIVAAGSQGALPHGSPRDVAIAVGDIVVIDWGAALDGYLSDCTRTVAVGEPGEQAREIYELVLGAQLAGVQAVRAGAACRVVDAAARSVIEEAGHGEHFGHGLGHGVGLAIHEAPWLRSRAEGTLGAGNVVTVEPGVYLPGAFGVRIEDLVVVGEDGCEILTGISKELLVVD